MKKTLLLGLLGVMLCAQPAQAQLDETFQEVFDFFLRNKIQLSGELHGVHFLPSAILTDSLLTPALNSLLASNISSFPLNSTVAGTEFDFATGRWLVTGSLGPIFAETAETLGQGKFSYGLNFSYLGLDKFRGLSTRDMRFTFTHQDNSPNFPFGPEDPNTPSHGNPTFENDTIDLILGLDVNAALGVFFLTAGITNKLDIGVAVPIVNVQVDGHARALVNSATFGRSGGNPQFEGAAHRFGGTLLNPVLSADTTYSASSSGFGDIALRVKYNVVKDMAVLVDVRFPTGDERNFLGTGETNARFSWIVSRPFGDFTPHLNMAYDLRSADRDSDEFEFIAGFDQKIADGVTFAFDVLGAIDLNQDETIVLFPGTTTIRDTYANELGSGGYNRVVDLSNIPERDYDHTFAAALGFKVSPRQNIIFLGSIIAPLNDGGLQSGVVPTIGLNIVL